MNRKPVRSLLGSPSSNPRDLTSLLGIQSYNPNAQMPSPTDRMMRPTPQVGLPQSQLQQLAQPTLFGRVRQGVSDAGKGLKQGLLDFTTGPYSDERLRGLSSALLTPSAGRKKSFGERLMTGLESGAKLESDRKQQDFKNKLLQQEMDLQQKKLSTEVLGDVFNVTDMNGNIVGQVVSGTPGYQNELLNPNTLLSKINTTSNSGKKYFDVFTVNEQTGLLNKQIGTYPESGIGKYLADPRFAVTEAGKASSGAGFSAGSPKLSNDTIIFPDGRVQILEGSKTAIQLGLSEDQLILSQEEFDFKKRMAEEEDKRKQSEEERKQKKFDIETQNNEFAKQQAEDGAYSTLGQVSRLIDDMYNDIKQNKESYASLFGPTSIIKDIPIFGPSSAQGVFANKRDQLQSILTIDTIRSMKDQSSTGATGFGALNKEELATIEKFRANLQQATTEEEFTRNLNNLKIFFDASYYGVKNKEGLLESYSPTKHDESLYGPEKEFTINRPVNNTSSPEVVRVYNPETGEFTNGQ